MQSTIAEIGGRGVKYSPGPALDVLGVPLQQALVGVPLHVGRHREPALLADQLDDELAERRTWQYDQSFCTICVMPGTMLPQVAPSASEDAPPRHGQHALAQPFRRGAGVEQQRAVARLSILVEEAP